jgi:hypothetical protein
MCIAAGCLLAAASASAQTWWDYTFDQWPLGAGVLMFGTGCDSIESDALITDAGPPQGHVLTLSVDSSACNSAWSISWILNPHVTFAGYDPERTFLSFDALASKLKPFSVRLEYVDQGGSFATRDLWITVTPTNAGTFQHYSIPLTAFSTTYLSGNPPDYPTAVYFFIAGDPATPDTSWGFDTNNVLSVDYLSYTVFPPPLSIGAATNGMIVSWPTSVTAFVLQQSSTAEIGSWTDVTNAPVVAGDFNQLIVFPTASQGFYRLRSP